MGFDDGHIVLDRNGSYSTGETIHGKLVFDQEKVKTFRGLYIKMKGYCDVHWATSHRRTVNGRSENYTVNYNSHETYFEQKLYLMGSDHGEVKLQPGHHEFPFQFLIPTNCPSSFRGSYGHIDYEIKCVVDRSMKFDQEKKVTIDVVAKKDLNADPYCREPLTFEFNESYCCWCMYSGTCDVEVKLPASGYVPGQTIHIQVNCTNKSNVEIDKIKLELKEEITFRATSEPGSKTLQDIIAKIKKGPVPAHTTRNWIVEMEIPDIDVRNVDSCKYIDVDYEFAVNLSTSGCHSDSGNSSRIVIGHIPLREFEGHHQNQMQNTEFIPLQDPIGSPFPPSPYPNSPYLAGANAPYPEPKTSPMPNPPMMNPPPTRSPYPPNAPPSANLSPGAPNNGRVSPYPGAISPYPGATPPYPGANPPYPGAKSPYTNATPPYPTGPSPVSNNTPISIGFNIQPSPGDKTGASMPLLPHGGAPYPTTTSPYPNASAPEPSTPDALKSPPLHSPEHK